MKVVLNQDVKALGKKGEVVDVSDGYARNFLLPKNLAVAATASALNAVKLKNEADEHRRKEERKAAEELCKKLNKTAVTVKIKTGANGKLYGALNTASIAQALADAGIELDKKKIVLHEPIKTLGRHEITVKPYADLSAKLIVNVVAEE